MFLASSIDQTAEQIAKEIDKDPKSLKLVFISTAAEAEEGDKRWLKDDRDSLAKEGFDITDYTLTGKSSSDIQNDLERFDIVHINGGNSFYLLIQARKSGFDKWVREVIFSGKKIYIGSSVGSMVASPNIEIARKIETKDYENKLKSFESFGLVDFITLPHWGSDYFKSSYLNHRLDFAYKPENKIILLNDWQYVKVEGEMYKIVDIRD